MVVTGMKTNHAIASNINCTNSVNMLTSFSLVVLRVVFSDDGRKSTKNKYPNPTTNTSTMTVTDIVLRTSFCLFGLMRDAASIENCAVTHMEVTKESQEEQFRMARNIVLSLACLRDCDGGYVRFYYITMSVFFMSNSLSKVDAKCTQ
jgi:hypothetical protein